MSTTYESIKKLLDKEEAYLNELLDEVREKMVKAMQTGDNQTVRTLGKIERKAANKYNRLREAKPYFNLELPKGE